MATGYSSTVKPVVPGPKSIAARAIAAHPAWGTTPKGQSLPVTSGLKGQSLPAANKVATQPAATHAAATTTAAATQTAAASPLDSTYYGNVAQNQFNANNKINQLNLTGAQDQTALTQALAALSYQQPRDQLHLMQHANAQGGLYSSQEGMNQGDLVHQYTVKQTAAQERYQAQRDAIDAQIQAIRGNLQFYQNSQYNAAVARAIAADQKDQGLGQTAVTPSQTTTTAAASTVSAAHPATSSTGKSQLAAAMAEQAAAKQKQAQAAQAQKAKAKGYSSTAKRVK